MKKILFCLIIIFQSVYLYANEDIKLSCNVKLVITSWNGIQETQQIKDDIEISEIGNKKYIIGNHPDIGSVSTHKSGSRWISATDQSDRNKWNITTIRSREEDVIVTTQFIIDRNSGKIIYSEDAQGPGKKYMRYKGIGDCQKIDITKRKF